MRLWWTKTIAARFYSPRMPPAIFSTAWSAAMFSGKRPRPGESARTTGDYASNYKSRVLPVFLSVEDDPTLKTFAGKTLIGSYDADDEGVRAAKVPVVEDGLLVNYLLGREPIRDFPESNGHGRAAPGQSASPNIGNLIVESKQRSLAGAIEAEAHRHLPPG